MTPEQVLPVLLLATLTTTASLPLSSTTGGCPKLSPEETSQLLKKVHWDMYQELHWTFWLLPDLQQSKYVDTGDKWEGAISDKSTYVYGAKKCTKVKKIDKEFDCPAQYLMHNDVNRIPENIVYAKCVCERCRHANANPTKECQPVYTLTKVLRRKSDCSYDWTYDRVPVACTCKSKGGIIMASETNAQ